MVKNLLENVGIIWRQGVQNGMDSLDILDIFWIWEKEMIYHDWYR